MRKWRLIRSAAASGAWNMALDEALLASVEAGESLPVLRLYRWQPATVTLGYFQQGTDVVNLEACRQLGFDVVRRITGGRAVLHADEVTYAVIAPEMDSIFPGGVAANYHVIAEVLQLTLAACGLQTEITSGRHGVPQDDSVQRSACFTAPALSELVHAGCKMTGSAQKRLSHAFLQHGSIPVEVDLDALCRALYTGNPDGIRRSSERLQAHVGWLNRFLATPTCIDAVESMLIAQFVAHLDIDFCLDEPTAAELMMAEQLLREKYDNRDWTLKGILVNSSET